MTTNQLSVHNWMHAFGQVVNNKPTNIDNDTRLLRARLIYEEAIETVTALGCYVGNQGVKLNFHSSGFVVDKVKLVDGLADLDVVRLGTASAYGISMRHIPNIVMQSNNSKSWTGEEVNHIQNSTCFVIKPLVDIDGLFVVQDHYGKILKPPSFIPPEAAIAVELKRQERDGIYTDS